MKNIFKLDHIRMLAISTGLVLVVFFMRNMILSDHSYNFLMWNLFLAVIPLIAALLIQWWDGAAKLFKITLASIWLLFYPNAPYMVSDLIHVQSASATVIYDTLIIFMISMLALFYGFYSLKIMQSIFASFWGNKKAFYIILGCILLSSFGIYLGRILRLNSWDLFTNPIGVMESIWDHLFPPTKNPVTYLITFLFTMVQAVCLVLIRDLDSKEDS